jgi:hypothetical protein
MADSKGKKRPREDEQMVPMFHMSKWDFLGHCSAAEIAAYRASSSKILDVIRNSGFEAPGWLSDKSA